MGEANMLWGFMISTHTQKKNARETRPRTKVLTITRRIGEWRIWWNTYKDGWRGTGWKNSLELFEKTRRRKDIGALQREMTNHHRINLFKSRCTGLPIPQTRSLGRSLWNNFGRAGRIDHHCRRSGCFNSAKGGITRASVTGMTILYSLCISRQPTRHSYQL